MVKNTTMKFHNADQVTKLKGLLIQIPIYDLNIFFVVGSANKMNNIVDVTDLLGAVTMPNTANLEVQFIMWVKHKNDLNTFGHELHHLVNSMYKYITGENEMRVDKDEIYANWSGYLLEKMLPYYLK